MELFGINADNYGRFVLDKLVWESKYGIDADSLVREPLQPATWGRWRPIPDETWPGITLYSQLDRDGRGINGLMTLRCKRGETRWRAWISVGRISASLVSGEPVQVVHSLYHNKTEPVQWRLAGPYGYSNKLWALWEDTGDSQPYDRRLLDGTLEGLLRADDYFKVEMQSRGGAIEHVWSTAGMQTAASWLLAECERLL